MSEKWKTRLVLAFVIVAPILSIPAAKMSVEPAPAAPPSTPAVFTTPTTPLATPTVTPTPTKRKTVRTSRAASRSNPPVVRAPKPATGGPSASQWAALRQCENSGSYRSAPGDRYRGAYQFDYSTWRGQGGTGDPADAPAWEQDMRAKSLYADRGAQPWPVCGRHLS